MASVADPVNKIVSACVSIAPMLLTADENVQPGEVESGWFHITGFFQGGEVRVMVNESSAYYSQSTYSASASAGPRMAGDSILPYNKPNKLNKFATFWLAASLPSEPSGPCGRPCSCALRARRAVHSADLASTISRAISWRTTGSS